MSKWTVSYALRGYYDVNIEAETKEEAEKKAYQIMLGANCGDLINPQSEHIDTWQD